MKSSNKFYGFNCEKRFSNDRMKNRTLIGERQIITKALIHQ